MSNEQRPLFSVGERVKLVSKNYPECNGEYIVERILGLGDKFTCRITGKSTTRSELNKCAFGYLLDLPYLKDGNVEHHWAETSLRKIYDTGEYSFDELMNVLKSPIVVRPSKMGEPNLDNIVTVKIRLE